MRKLLDSGAFFVMLFLAGLVLSWLRRRADKRERSTYHILEPAPANDYACYHPVRDRIIPKEQWKDQPTEVLAALWTVNEIRSEELPSLAADLLEIGRDGKYLRRLAGEMNARTRADVCELADVTFAELGVAEPMDVAAANRVLTKLLAEKVLKQELEPAKAVLAVAWLHDWDPVGPAGEFVILNYAYEELYEHGGPTRDAELEQQTQAACLEFISKHGSRPRSG